MNKLVRVLMIKTLYKKGRFLMEPFDHQRENDRKGSKGKVVMAGIIGALFLFLIIPSLSEDEKANDSLEEKNPLKRTETNVSAAEEDEESNSITKAVDKSMDAVVSVINYQGGDMW